MTRCWALYATAPRRQWLILGGVNQMAEFAEILKCS